MDHRVGRGGHRVVLGQALGRRQRLAVGEVGVDRDGQSDLTTQLLRQGLGDVHAQSLLDEVLREVVGNGDQGGVVEEADEAGHAEEGTSGDGNAVGIEGVEGGSPDLTEVDLASGHGRTPQLFCGSAADRD